MAPAPGTVVRTLERGDKTKEGEDAVILSCADRGFVFEGKLDKDSARHFSAGDKGELHYGLDGSSQKQMWRFIPSVRRTSRTRF